MPPDDRPIAPDDQPAPIDVGSPNPPRDGTVQDAGATRGGDSGRGREATTPPDIPPSGWKDIGRRVLAEVKSDNLTVVAAGVAFYAWLAVLPAIIAVVLVYGLVADPAQVTEQLRTVTASVSPAVADILTEVVSNVTTTDQRGLTLGLVATLLGVMWTASAGIDGLVRGINIAYDEELRSFPRRRGIALLLTIGAVVLAITVVALITVAPWVLEQLGLGSFTTLVVNVARWVLLALLVCGSLAVLYRFAPYREDAQWRWLTWGAGVATVLWLAGSAGFAVYVRLLGTYDATYGALAGVIILNLWLFLSAFVVLLGAEVNAEMEAQTRRDTTTGEPEPMGQRGAVKADTLGPIPGSPD